MKVLGVAGSPRTGNTSFCMQEALYVVEEMGLETEFISLHGKNIAPCRSCGRCREEDACSINDDMEDINAKIGAADGIIFGTPVFMGSMTAQMKILLDRTVRHRRQGLRLKGKVGGVICVGGARNGGQELTIQAVQAALQIHDMILVGDGSHFGGIVVAYDPGEAKDDEEGLETVKNLARRVAETVIKLNP